MKTRPHATASAPRRLPPPVEAPVEIAVHVDGSSVRYDGATLTAPASRAVRREIAHKLEILADVLRGKGGAA